MASREGQGMQIAVILFAILTVLLAITTYIYYAGAEKKEKERQAAVESEKTAKAGQAKANYQLAALKYMVGLAAIGDVDTAKNAAGGAEDPEVQKWLADYNQDLLLFGDAAPEQVKNYRTLPTYLISSISRKNASVVTATAQLVSEQAQKTAAVTSEQARAQKAEEDLAKQAADYTTERKTINETQQNNVKTLSETAAKLAEVNKTATKTIGEMKAQNDQIVATMSRVQQTSDQMAKARNELQAAQGANIDNPDATILWINQKQRLVWIDRGSDDGLGRQMTFAVYSQNQASLFNNVSRMRKDGAGMEKVKKLESKGRIEVVRVIDRHQAECRILEDKASNPILPGDWVHSPAWSPGQRLHFALVGFMDIDGDLDSDRELIKHIITMNGGVIDTEIKDDGTRDTGKMSVNTRYVVTGNLSETSHIKNLTQYKTTYNAFVDEMNLYSVEKISVQQLLDMMGWKPEEKTTGLGGGMDAGFRSRTPYGPKGAAPKTPGAAPGTPADPGAEGAPPAAETPAAEAPAGVPGKAPAKKPAAADAADPFGK